MPNKDTAKKYAICSVDGSTLYKSEHSEYPYTFSLLKNGRPNVERFGAVLDDNLDVRYLSSEVYSLHRDQMGGRHMFFMKDKKREIHGTVAIIHVTFEHAIKKYEHKGEGRYWLTEERYDENCEWADHICLSDSGELLGVEVINQKAKDKKDYAPVVFPVDCDRLVPTFEYDADSKAYRLVKKTKQGNKNGGENKIKTCASTEEIRKDLYEKGFTVDGIHYVRYKRSAGSGRDGSCLFIAEPLYSDMMQWSCCGIDGTAVADQASWQAYISLTLSSVIDIVSIPRKAIMLIPDVEVQGREEVICIERGEEKDGETVSLRGERKTVEYSNKIWDGEALLDESVFEALECKDKGKTWHDASAQPHVQDLRVSNSIAKILS